MVSSRPASSPHNAIGRAWRVGDGDRQEPQDGGMGVVVVMAHGGIIPPRSERVLREVVRADGEEVHVAGDRSDAEHGGGRLDHRTEGGPFRAGERPERGVGR
jgi:hypothetical protein